jgi:hypothetical protein
LHFIFLLSPQKSQVTSCKLHAVSAPREPRVVHCLCLRNRRTSLPILTLD